MRLLLRVAWRNLREHKAKTIIVGVLIAIGVIMLVIGNAFLATVADGTRMVFINNFTGHVMIRAKSDAPVSITGGTGFSLDDIVAPNLPEYRAVHEYLSGLDGVTAVNPQLPYFGQIDYSTPDKTRGAYVPLLGIDPESFTAMFEATVRVVEGRFLESGERGLVLHAKIRNELRDELEEEINVGDEIRLQSLTGTGSVRIRRVPVVGIFEFEAEAPAMDGVSYLDITTARALAGMVLGTSATVDLDAGDTSLLDASFDFEELFSESIEISSTASGFDVDALFEDGLDSLEVQTDSGAWAYILLRLQDEAQTQGFIQRINQTALERGWEIEAVGWEQASGGMATMVQSFQAIFLIMVMIIMIVAVIIIMNTLVVSITERTAEIGTMRALGAQKAEIRRLFVLETMSIALVFGSIGLLLGILILSILGVAGVPIENDFMKVLFGASLIRPQISVGGIIQAVFMMLGVGFLSSLYPVSVAMRVRPVQAMRAE